MGKSNIYYGWYVVVAGFFITFTLGEAMWSFGVFFKPLASDFGWSRAVVSSGYTAFLIGFGISSIVFGRLADIYSPRPILLVSALLAGTGIALCSRVETINELRFFLFVGGLGGGATWSVPTSAVQKWFYQRERAGLALGIVISGIGIGAMVFTPLINWFIATWGWRHSYLIVGAFYFLIIAAAALVMKKSPEASKEETDDPISTQQYEWTAGTVLLNPSFIAIMSVNCLVVIAFQTVTVHIVPYATDRGVSMTVAAAALGLMGGFSFFGRILSGFIADIMRWQWTLVVACTGLGIFILFLMFVETPWMLYCFVAFFGLFLGIRSPAHVGVIGEFFGMRSLGELIGITSAAAMLASALAPALAGFIFDTTGSYLWAFIIVMVLLLVGGLIAARMEKPTIPHRPCQGGLSS